MANCVDDVKGEFTGKHSGKDEELSLKDFLCGRFEGEYLSMAHSSLLSSDRFIDECWGGEGLLW